MKAELRKKTKQMLLDLFGEARSFLRSGKKCMECIVQRSTRLGELMVEDSWAIKEY
jgi:hypothetical protein